MQLPRLVLAACVASHAVASDTVDEGLVLLQTHSALRRSNESLSGYDDGQAAVDEWIEVISGKSGTADDAPTSVSCPTELTLTGCSCYSPWASCDGAKANGNTCTAYNKAHGGGVYAQARCGFMPGASNFQEVLSGKSGTSDDAPTSASCPAGTTLTGCSCYSPWASCDGAKASGNTCTAYNKAHGGGVFAQARCGVVPGSSNWQEVISSRSGNSDDSPTSASCPGSTTLTGCSCYSPWASCDGAKASGNTCTAYNMAHGAGVYAQARCGTMAPKATTWCQYGIVNADSKSYKCCAASCGTCGGSKCGLRPGGQEACCHGSILSPCASMDDVACTIPTPSPTHSPTPAPTPSPTTTTTTTTTIDLEGLDGDELENEVDDEEENLRECRNWCYSKKHKAKAWEGWKCNWYACSICPECSAA